MQCQGDPAFAKSYLYLVLAFLIVLVVLYTDLVFIDTSLIAEGPPEFKAVYLLRIFLIAISSLFLVVGIVRLKSFDKDRAIPHDAAKISPDWGVLTWSTEDPVKRIIFSLTVKEVIVWVVLLLSLSFLSIFLYRPWIFYKLCKEGGPVETFSAVLLFLSCAVFLYIFIKLRRSHTKTNSFYLITSLFFLLTFLLVGMEEVSWFQRVLNIDTPQAFNANMQKEINLHNYLTNEVENTYYFSSFLFLILIPFINDTTSLFQKYSRLSFFIPSRFVLLVSAIAVTYNYDMWNIMFTQISFFITLFIIIYYGWHMRSVDHTFLLPFLFTVYCMTQVLFLIYGSNFKRSWDVTEYREFFIPLSFLFYSLEILHRSNKLELPTVSFPSHR